MKRLRILFFVCVIVVFTASFSYGESMSLQDEQISFELPAGWADLEPGEYDRITKEYYNAAEEELEESREDAAELLLLKYKEFAGVPCTVELLYASDNYGQLDYEDCDEEELSSYFDDYGYPFIQDMLPQSQNSVEISQGEEILSGDWGPFLVGDVKEQTIMAKDIRYRVYYTVKEGCTVTILLTCYGTQIPSQAEAEAEQMVKSFSDEGYYTFYIGSGDTFEDDEFDDVWDDESSSFDITGLMFVLIGLGPVIAAAVNFWNKKDDEGAGASVSMEDNRPEKQVVQMKETPPEQTRRELPKPLKTPKPKPNPKAAVSKFYPVKEDGKVVQVRSRETSQPRRAKTSDESYLSSLKTLLDSGLLTKAQYREMIEKHNKREH